MSFVGWLACAGTHDPGAGAAPAASSEAIDPDAIAGTWTSPPCGERTWVRTLVIEAGGAYHGTDPVSPCPPGVQCIWSGIIEFRGTWAVEDRVRLALTEADEPRPAPARAVIRPSTLTMRGGALFDAEGCRFERVAP